MVNVWAVLIFLSVLCGQSARSQSIDDVSFRLLTQKKEVVAEVIGSAMTETVSRLWAQEDQERLGTSIFEIGLKAPLESGVEKLIVQINLASDRITLLKSEGNSKKIRIYVSSLTDTTSNNVFRNVFVKSVDSVVGAEVRKKWGRILVGTGAGVAVVGFGAFVLEMIRESRSAVFRPNIARIGMRVGVVGVGVAAVGGIWSTFD